MSETPARDAATKPYVRPLPWCGTWALAPHAEEAHYYFNREAVCDGHALTTSHDLEVGKGCPRCHTCAKKFGQFFGFQAKLDTPPEGSVLF